MARSIRALAAQLESWGRVIREMTQRREQIRSPAPFDEVMYLDELRALHVIAQAKLEAYRSASGKERDTLGGEIDSIWSELALALGHPRAREPGNNGSSDT